MFSSAAPAEAAPTVCCRAGNGRASVPAADVNAMRASCRATATVPGLAELRQTGNYRVLTPNDLASIFALLRPIPGFATLLLGDRLTRAFQGARRPAVRKSSVRPRPVPPYQPGFPLS